MPRFTTQSGQVVELTDEQVRQLIRGPLIPGAPIIGQQVQAATTFWYQPPEEPDEMPAATVAVNTHKIGADPEFVCLSPQGGLQMLNGVLPHLGRLGYDHHGRVAEIRPTPSRSAWRVLENIQRIILDAPASLRAMKWRAGGVWRHPAPSDRRESLGGHVHFGVAYGSSAQADIVDACDCLTTQLEGLDILPASESQTRREVGEYGRFGDVRPAGSTRHLEYRTPASWLFSPLTAYCCLTGYKLASSQPLRAMEVLKGKESAVKLRRFFELFKNKDDDTDRILKLHDDAGSLRIFRGDPDADFKTEWRVLP